MGTDALKVARTGVIAPVSARGFDAFMTDHPSRNRNLRLDLLALGLLALVVFLALSLLTYSPADPVIELASPLNQLYHPDILVYPQNETVQNVCGHWGALVASMLFTGLGLGAYYLVVSLAILDVLLLMRREIDTPVVRAFGWCMSLIGLTTIASLAVPSWSPGPVIGSGGYLGALGAGLLAMRFATIGALVLSTGLVMGGLLLATEYTLVHVISTVLDLTMAGMASGRALLPVRRKTQAASDVGAGSDLAVRIGGVVMDESDEEDEEEEDDEAADDEEEEEVAEEDSEAEATADEEADTKPEPTVRGGGKNAEAANTGPRVKNRPNKNERQQVMQSLDEASLPSETHDYQLPSLDLLTEADDVCFEAQNKEVRRKAKILERTFANFGFNVKVVEIETGPVIAQYEVELEAGLRLSRITGLADDLAIALRVPSVRIVAPIPGKNTVGIEVPNETRQVVRLREVMEETNGKIKKMKIPLFLGKDVSGNPLTVDLATMPHLLIAGRTGTGKSVCLNAIISSILMTRRPDEVRMLMIDPKMVELSGYGRLPHLMHPVVTDMRKAEAIFAWAVEKMEERYALLARTGVRHITSYNQLGKTELIERLQPEDEDQAAAIPDHLPFIVIVADEIADLMMTAGKEVEQHIIRLAQKSRAVGIHLILATQKPTVDVITGLIKSNLPARISFQVASRIDSRVVLDEMGADKLLGNGDMLFLWPGTSTLLRGQGTYLSDDEINAVVATVSTGEQNFVNELVNMQVEKTEGGATDPQELRKRDELYESAIDIVIREGRGSVSLLQRALGIGYGRAARLIDFMAEDGIVGDYNGSQAREILLTLADWEKMQGLESSGAPPTEASPAPPKSRRAPIVRPDTDDWDASTSPAQPAPSPKRTKTSKSSTSKSPTSKSPTSKSAQAMVVDTDDELEDEDALFDTDEEIDFRESAVDEADVDEDVDDEFEDDAFEDDSDGDSDAEADDEEFEDYDEEGDEEEEEEEEEEEDVENEEDEDEDEDEESDEDEFEVDGEEDDEYEYVDDEDEAEVEDEDAEEEEATDDDEGEDDEDDEVEEEEAEEDELVPIQRRRRR